MVRVRVRIRQLGLRFELVRLVSNAKLKNYS